MKKLFPVAGEISGDTHGAALLAALPGDLSSWELVGLGGPKMHSLSPAIENWLDDAAVLGIWEVLKKYRWFSRKMDETVERIHQFAPDGILLIDYPGFNLRLAQRLRDEGYHGKLIYYISPQVWAWKKGRVKKMAELLDLMICIFPFEKELYEKSGLKTIFAGHPLIDSLAERRANPVPREKGFIALLPGSREREIMTLFPPMLDAAGELLSRNQGYRFATSGATPVLTDLLLTLVSDAGLSDQIEVGESTSQDLMQRAEAGVVASGTATLEAACLGLPYCLVYKVAWQTALVARWLLSIRFLGIVNVIANREVVTELLQEKVSGQKIADELYGLIENAEKSRKLQQELAEISAGLGGGGAHERAADSVSKELDQK